MDFTVLCDNSRDMWGQRLRSSRGVHIQVIIRKGHRGLQLLLQGLHIDVHITRHFHPIGKYGRGQRGRFWYRPETSKIESSIINDGAEICYNRQNNNFCFGQKSYKQCVSFYTKCIRTNFDTDSLTHLHPQYSLGHPGPPLDHTQPLCLEGSRPKVDRSHRHWTSTTALSVKPQDQAGYPESKTKMPWTDDRCQW